MEKTFLDLALILIATKAGGLVSRKFKMPEVLGALVAGVLLGPVGFGLVKFSPQVQLLSNLGVVFLMFLAGLETNLDEFRKAGRSAFAIASLGVAVPLVIGTLSSFLFFSNLLENIFLGVILTATSVSITVETLTELGKLNTRVGINILGAAVIDDVLGLVLISVILAVGDPAASGSTGTSLGSTLVGVGVFCAGAVFAIAFFPKRLNRLMRKIRPGRTVLTVSIAVALLAAALAEKLGIAAITDAYLFGLLLSQLHQKEYLERSITAISSGFLSPIFFASVGMEASPKGLNAGVVLITMTMFAVAVVGKVAGCGLAARLFHFSRSESLQIGTGMISRGEVAIITANIGLQNHIISQQIFLPTILVVILTTVVTPILLKLTFSHKFSSIILHDSEK